MVMSAAVIAFLLTLLWLHTQTFGHKAVYAGPGAVTLVTSYTSEEVAALIDEKTRGVPLAWRPTLFAGFAWADKQVSEEELLQGLRTLKEGHTILIRNGVLLRKSGDFWVSLTRNKTK